MAQKDKDKHSDLQQRIDELTADLQRVHADFINFRRRNDEERSGLMESAKVSVLAQLLPLVDNIERSLTHLPDDLKANKWAQGVVQLEKQWQTTLEKLGVTKIKALGQPFDPELHEAVSYEEDGEGEEVVIEVLQEGYTQGDHVLRHAMVKVGKRKKEK